MAKTYAYTQHVGSIRAIEAACNTRIEMLRQDRSKDPVEDIASQLAPVLASGQSVALYAVMPIDKAVELKEKFPQIRLILMQLDGKIIERITGKPYDPKQEYPADIVLKALKLIEVRGGSVRYVPALLDMLCELRERGLERVAVFNDTLREAIRRYAEEVGINVELTKTCNGGANCIEINPLGAQSGWRISFPGTVGRLTVYEMVEMFRAKRARVYYVEIRAAEIPLCQ